MSSDLAITPSDLTKEFTPLQEIKKQGLKSNIQFSVILITFLLGFAFILTIKSFWTIESILWNRIPYKTGDGALKVFVLVQYLTEDLDVLQSTLNTQIILYLIGLCCSLLFSLLLFYHTIVSKKEIPHQKFIFIFGSLWALINFIFGFWLKKSIEVIETFPSFDITKYKSGSEWINGEIGDISSKIVIIGQWTSYVFLGITFLLICTLIFVQIRENRQNWQIKKKFKSERNISHNILQLIENIPVYIILIIYLIFTLLPIYLTFKASVSSPYELRSGINPRSPIYSLILNFSSVLFSTDYGIPPFSRAFRNSTIIAIGTGTIGLAVSLTSAYSLARFKFKANKVLSFLILTTQMFPGIILLIPQYIIWGQLGLLQKNLRLFGLLLASASGATAYCTWMMKGYFETIPEDMEEAAMIDGANRFKTFIRIAVPLAKAGIVAVLVFTFLSSWQEFVLARTFIQGEDAVLDQTLPMLFQNYQDLGAPDVPTFYELLTPYSILLATPVVIFFMFIQKQLAAGSIAGGVK